MCDGYGSDGKHQFQNELYTWVCMHLAGISFPPPNALIEVTFFFSRQCSDLADALWRPRLRIDISTVVALAFTIVADLRPLILTAVLMLMRLEKRWWESVVFLDGHTAIIFFNTFNMWHRLSQSDRSLMPQGHVKRGGTHHASRAVAVGVWVADGSSQRAFHSERTNQNA